MKKLCSTCCDVPHMVPPPNFKGDEVKCPECSRIIPLRRSVASPKFSATEGMSLPVLIPTGLRGSR